MGAFAVEVSINVGDMGSSEEEHEAWMKDGLAGREELTPVEKDKIIAGFDLSQRGPGGYLHGGPPPMHLLGHR